MNFWGRVSINHNVQFQKMSMATSCKVTANSEGVGWEMGQKTQNLEGWGERAKLEKPWSLLFINSIIDYLDTTIVIRLDPSYELSNSVYVCLSAFPLVL